VPGIPSSNEKKQKLKRDFSFQSMAGKEILITGGLGFLGSNLAHRLIPLGANITIFDAMIPGLGGNMINICDIEDKVHVILGDIRDHEKIKEVVKEKDYIFNFAAQTNHVLSMRDPYLDIDINCRGTITFLETCRRSNSDAKIIYSGSRSQIGEPLSTPVDENHPEFPLDVYSANKAAAEKYHLLYAGRYGLKVACLRITNTYGPRHQIKHWEYGFVNWWIREALLNESIEIWGDGQQIRDLLFVDDVVDACILAAQSDKANGEVFFLVSGDASKLIELAQLIIRIAGKGRYALKPFPEERTGIYPTTFVGSYKKINEILGWFPKTDLEDGIKKTIAFYKKQLQAYLN
jgi:UDP-glucose 4-epimerase